MQIENELKEIFESNASLKYTDQFNYREAPESYMNFEDLKKALPKILALGKPEPLAKNKQFEQVCACIPSPPFINEDNLNIPYCRWCGEDFKQT